MYADDVAETAQPPLTAARAGGEGGAVRGEDDVQRSVAVLMVCSPWAWEDLE
ncbi:hypothetical protein GCM10010255_80310 [Streptomyces coeruleofuscus]|uniref:Uncharacterized protein n=1 Tax=Streptomyces coeruleofuscus TaxID=66879 RepID=A0ABN3JB47_9ACTN